MRGAFVLTLVLVAAGSVACSDSEPSSSQRLAAGQVVPTRVFDVRVKNRASVPLPSGILSLGLAPSLTTVTTPDGSVEGAEGTNLVGLSWTFEPQPNSDAFDALLGGKDRQDLPKPTLSVLDDQDEIEIPGDQAQAGLSGAAVVAVASDAPTLRVDFDGASQTVDFDTGSPQPGSAAGLDDLAARGSNPRLVCDARDFPRSSVLDHGCGVDSVYRLPYVLGLGWGDGDRGWLVLDVRVEGTAKVRVSGEKGQPLQQGNPRVQRLAFPSPTGKPRVEFDFGGTIGVVGLDL